MIRHFTASGVVLTSDDHVLLVEHRKLGCWLYPGGHILPDEDPVGAVLREVAEETGLVCEIVAESRFRHPTATILPAPFTIGVQDVPADEKAGPHQHIDLIYVLSQVSGHLAPQLEEIIRCEWVPVASVSDLAVPPELPALIASAAKYAHTVLKVNVTI